MGGGNTKMVLSAQEQEVIGGESEQEPVKEASTTISRNHDSEDANNFAFKKIDDFAKEALSQSSLTLESLKNFLSTDNARAAFKAFLKKEVSKLLFYISIE